MQKRPALGRLLEKARKAFKREKQRPARLEPTEILTTIRNYQVLREIGSGAFAIVYEAIDSNNGARVAIKKLIFDSSNPANIELVERFAREAQIIANFRHENIVQVVGFGYAEDKRPYIAMEFVEGITLQARLRLGKPMELSEAVGIMKGVLSALQYCHSHKYKVVHRDIKPANIMITAFGQAKVVDFGIARLEGSTMTQEGSIQGSAAYMSPEQWLGKETDFRTDIYAAGVILYYLLTGKRPFEGPEQKIMHDVLSAEPPAPPSSLPSAITAALDEVVERAMKKEPLERFDSADAFAAAIDAALEAERQAENLRRHSERVDSEGMDAALAAEHHAQALQAHIEHADSEATIVAVKTERQAESLRTLIERTDSEAMDAALAAERQAKALQTLTEDDDSEATIVVVKTERQAESLRTLIERVDSEAVDAALEAEPRAESVQTQTEPADYDTMRASAPIPVALSREIHIHPKVEYDLPEFALFSLPAGPLFPLADDQEAEGDEPLGPVSPKTRSEMDFSLPAGPIFPLASDPEPAAYKPLGPVSPKTRLAPAGRPGKSFRKLLAIAAILTVVLVPAYLFIDRPAPHPVAMAVVKPVQQISAPAQQTTPPQKTPPVVATPAVVDNQAPADTKQASLNQEASSWQKSVESGNVSGAYYQSLISNAEQAVPPAQNSIPKAAPAAPGNAKAPLPASATDLDTATDFEAKGDAAIKQQDYKAAFADYSQAAANGGAHAQYMLGVMYDSGQMGVAKDDGQAALWLQKAADQGYAEAQDYLGTLYDSGQGVTLDHEKAAELYRKAARRRNIEAEFNLGQDYALGEGVPRDPVQSAFWFQKAAVQGDSYSQYNLGLAYENGSGIARDDAQARYWIGKAAKNGVSDAQTWLANHPGPTVSPPAPSAAGDVYASGADATQNCTQVLSFYRATKGQPGADAEYKLGLLYLKGQCVPQDYSQAADWFQIASNKQNAAATYNLGLLYERGAGVPKDDNQAVKLISAAALAGNSDAASWLLNNQTGGGTTVQGLGSPSSPAPAELTSVDSTAPPTTQR